MRVVVNEHPMYYEQSADHGVPIVFLHGIAGSADDWAGVRTLLPRFRTVAYDARGVGRSGLPGGGFGHTMDDLVSDLVALLDRLRLEAVHLVGASMGGGVAQYAALQHPDRVRCLVLVSSSSEFPPELRSRFAADASTARRYGMAVLADELVNRWFAGRDGGADARSQYTALDPEVFAQRCMINAQRDLTARLPELTCPVLFVAGARDPAFTTDTALTYLTRAGRCTAVLFGAASHCVEREAAGELAGAVAKFVRCHG